MNDPQLKKNPVSLFKITINILIQAIYQSQVVRTKNNTLNFFEIKILFYNN